MLVKYRVATQLVAPCVVLGSINIIIIIAIIILNIDWFLRCSYDIVLDQYTDHSHSYIHFILTITFSHTLFFSYTPHNIIQQKISLLPQ
jgi:hypothetical protein